MSLSNRSFQPRSRTAHEYVRTELRAAILEGELSGGTRLLQSEIGRQLGVSTTPVREALRDLASEGLVFFTAHQGAVVRTLSLEEVREIYELRMILEPLLIRRVVGEITEESLERAHTLWRKMDTETDPSVWVQLNQSFHKVFAEPAEGSQLAYILKGLRDRAAAYVGFSLKARPEQMRLANTDHGQMLELFKQRDAYGLTDLTVDHLRSTLAAIESQHNTHLR
jgi:DNA-binding GntR family transcriptional regulator